MIIEALKPVFIDTFRHRISSTLVIRLEFYVHDLLYVYFLSPSSPLDS